jgi:hypothetical protein
MPVGPTSAQLMPTSPATQREVKATIRTAPVELLTQAEIFVDTGAAMAAVLAISDAARIPKYLSEDIETSWQCCRA